MHNAGMCTLGLYDVIGITRHLHIKLKSFSEIGQPLHKEAVRNCSCLYIIAEKSVMISEAFLADVSIYVLFCCNATQHYKTKQNKVSKGAKSSNRYNQVPHSTQDTN